MRDRGSAILEGTVAIGLAFLLLALVAQVGFAVAARNAASAATGAAARRAARPGADPGIERDRLHQALQATVPGAGAITATVGRSGDNAVARSSFRWRAPGPGWLPITIRVEAAVPVMTPP